MRPPRRRTLLAFCALATATLSGCSFFDDILDPQSVANVRFFATHAGTPDENGVYPDYGDNETTRVFMNDTGWQISLSEVFVTTAEIRLVECAGPATPIEMFWGPCPEAFISEDDLDSVTLGAVTVPDGDYCGVDVIYAPYKPPPEGDDHIAPGNDKILDHTILVVGVARRGMGPDLEEVPFEILSKKTATARLDVSALEFGGPIHLEDENFPRDLTVIKTYDTFFDGVDFSVDGPPEIEAAIFAALELDTYAYDGVFDYE